MGGFCLSERNPVGFGGNSWWLFEDMVLQKKLDYGFNGYQVPPTPRAARSVRRRCSFKRKPDDHPMCAFDLLATVAGKLLDGGTCPPPPSSKEQPAVGENRIEKEEKNENKVLEENYCNRDPYERNFLITELVSEAPNPNCCFNELPCTQIDVVSRPVSGITSSDCSEKVGSAEQLVNDNCKLSLGINFTPPADVKSSGFHLSVNCGSEDKTRERGKMDFEITRNLSVGNKAPLSSSGHRVEACERKPSPLVSSVDSFKFSLSKNHGPCGSFPLNWDNVKLSNRDDDENSFECTEPSTRNKPFKPPPQVGEHRHRKFLASKHCKEASGVKDEECYNHDAARFNCLNRKDSSKRPRPMRDYPIKKRKIYDYNLESNSDDGINSDGVCKVPEKITNENGLGSGPSRPRVTPAPAVGGHLSIPSQNSQVKIKIKSFRVPELFIEIQENATIGSLKRSVLEAVNAVLGEGLRVGVLLQGKKIRDDSKTLLQTGIFHDNKIDALGFTLEPNPPPAPICLSPGVRHNQMLPKSPQPLTRYALPPNITQSNGYQGNLDAPPDLPGPSLNNFIESDHDSAPSPPAPSLPLRKVEPESRALVPVPPTKQDALAVVPFRKSKRCESAQRRIRRPFTVSEVEALVQAVEKLGTGRWRDVKLRAFDSAKHRTYVDLKDKWKTLVHTARISPQQRRGEPVPQGLLDRVLTAHAYWSQQQAKQQIKSHPDTCLLL